jgi:hypothetical protein
MDTSIDIDVAFAGDDLVLRLACAAYSWPITSSSCSCTRLLVKTAAPEQKLPVPSIGSITHHRMALP